MNRFEMKLLKNYHYLYLKRDVSLLAHVFEKFRNKSLKNYGLFPSYYLDAQGFIWYSMLKLTNLNLNLFQNMYTKVQEVKCLISLVDATKSTINI